MGHDQRSKVASGCAMLFWHRSGVLFLAGCVGVWSRLLSIFMGFSFSSSASFLAFTSAFCYERGVFLLLAFTQRIS
jgi:hypothetical protein